MCFYHFTLYESVSFKMNVLIIVSFILSLVALSGVCLIFYYMKQIEQKLLDQFTNAYNLEAKLRRVVNDHANLF